MTAYEIGGIMGAVLFSGTSLAAIALVINIPLAAKLYRERARLKELGLASLSKSLWKESRRGRWISRVVRWGPLIVFVITATVALWSAKLDDQEWKTGDIIAVVFCIIFVALLVLASYLRNQRERIDLTASAEELKKVFQGLQRHGDKSEKVSIPSELLEQAARIESAQIVKERKDAILQSVGARSSGYSVTFDRDAAKQRVALSTADRIELENLVARLSTEGPTQLELEAGAASYTSQSQRVDIGYKIDRESRSIRILGIAQPKEGGANA
jgi:hypothetical protein